MYVDSAVSYPLFSLRYIITNKRYNFSHFGIENERKSAQSALLDRVIEISCFSIAKLITMDKKSGFEFIPYSQFNVDLSVVNINFSKEEKLTIFRFGSQKYRCACLRDVAIRGVFHIVAFDFDYSLYKHN
jgi:hypothetical protein